MSSEVPVEKGGFETLGGTLNELASEKAASWAVALDRARQSNEKLAEWRRLNPRPHVTDVAAIQVWQHDMERFKIDILGEPEPEYKCPTCRDLGNLSEPDGEHSTRLVPCHACTDPKGQQLRLLHAARIPEFRLDKTFDSFSITAAPKMANAHAAALNFTNDFKPAWLALMGNHGCGKTHLCYAIANVTAMAGWKVRMWVVTDLLEEIRKSYSNHEPARSASDVIDEIAYEPEILILDDLGAEKQSDWVLEKMFQIIDKRYREGRPTVFTSNVPMEKIEPRVMRRLTDREMCRLIICDSPDFGKQMKPKAAK